MSQTAEPKPGQTAFHRVGIYRFSAAHFLVALALLFVVSPFVELAPEGDFVEPMLMSLVLVMGVLAVGQRRRNLVIAIVLAAPAFLGRWINHFRPDLLPPDLFYVCGLVFVAFVFANLLHFILLGRRVNSEVLCAGISAYLLLGLMWSFAYLLVAHLIPGSFYFNNGTSSSHTMLDTTAFYFSFMTLSTVGYGDIVPVSNVARMLAALEAICGLLFIAVLIARLVALYTTQSLSTDAHDSEG